MTSPRSPLTGPLLQWTGFFTVPSMCVLLQRVCPLLVIPVQPSVGGFEPAGAHAKQLSDGYAEDYKVSARRVSR